MKLTLIFLSLMVACTISQTLAWWGGGSRSSSSSSSGSRTSSTSRSSWGWSRRSSSSGSSNRIQRTSRTTRSGWWRRTSSNKPTARVKPVPKPKPKPKPKISRSWWRSKRKVISNRIPKPKPKPNPPTDMKTVIKKYEGIKLKAYDAQPNNKKTHDTTIGIGFNLNRPGAKKTFQKVLPGVNFEKVKSGKQSITETQATQLFNHDIDKIYEPRARSKIGTSTYNNLPSNVKTAVVNAVYRGDLGPKASKLMREGKWDQVSKEYLDHKQYKNADKLGIPGIKSRMDWNAKQFDTMKTKSNSG